MTRDSAESRRRIAFRFLGLVAFLGGWLAPGWSAGGELKTPRLGTIAGGSVRVRTGPSLNHFPFTTLPKDTSVIVVGDESDWYRILLPPYRTCWIHADYVESASADRLVVKGSRIRLRCSPNTTYQWIGVVNGGDSLTPTGVRKTDAAGDDWLECHASPAAQVYVSKQFVSLGAAIDPNQVVTLFRGLRPSGETKLATEPNTGTSDDKSQLQLPKFLSPRLAEIHSAVRREKQKPVLNWEFESILVALKGIRDSSEDLGEIRLAGEWIRQIETQILPLQADFVELQEKQVAARQGVELGKEKEKGLSRAVHRYSPTQDEKYLSVGWVVGLGKHRRVEGTHMLKKGNQLLFYLTSDTFDLDKYVNKRVGVQGTLKNLPPHTGANLILVTDIETLSK